jgi:P-type Mg2+ transporter
MYTGLTSAEASARLKTQGKNAIPEAKYRFLQLLARQFKGIFNILLIGAAIVTWILGSPVDAAFIMLFVVLSVGLNLYQEHKSNAAAQTLRSYLVRTITVRRDNADVDINIEDLVPGDILKLESGDIVPADAVVRHASALQVDETTFTGESVPVTKVGIEGEATSDENRLLQGVVIIRGSAFAEVVATGATTRLAQIAKTVSAVQSESEFTKGIDRISTFILRSTIITLTFVIAANVLIEGKDADIPALLIFAIALAVSVIPEVLPLVMTFSLSHGALRLAKESVIVKRLSSVQDLGSVELLCSDKTGTITENHLVYRDSLVVATSQYHPLVLSRLASNDLDESHPEPFDRATNEALDESMRTQVATFTLLEEEPFDPAVRSNGAFVQAAAVKLHIRRGSPEYFIETGFVKKEEIAAWIDAQETLGRRILGVSYDAGAGMVFGGLISFEDELKPSTLATVAAAKELNVALTIITGDSKRVAEAVGREIGLVTDGQEVMTAGDFFALPTHEQHERVRHIRVFARTTPEQKLEILELLKEQFTVGFLGEGINDAPALKSAHVSMVVQSASDVARETADIILLKSDLRVIVEGIRLGRETHANTLKYIRATLVSNFGNFYAVAIGSLFISFLPMLPKQLLLLNLLSDVPMMAIAFDYVSKEEVAQPQKYGFHALYIIFITLGLVSTVFDFMYFGLFYRISPEVLQTNWFIASALTEILLVISIRSMLPMEKAGRPAPVIIWLSVVAFALTLLIPVIPLTAHFFAFKQPTVTHLILIVSLALLYLATTEAVKRPLARFLKRHQTI